MTVDTAVRNRLRDFLIDLRTLIDAPFGWDKQGTDVAVIKLLETTPDVATACEQAVHWAGYANARTPAVIHDPAIQAKVAGVTNLPAPKSSRTSRAGTPNTTNPRPVVVTCERHGDGATMRADGWHSCCLTMHRSGEPGDVCDQCRKVAS